MGAKWRPDVRKIILSKRSSTCDLLSPCRQDDHHSGRYYSRGIDMRSKQTGCINESCRPPLTQRKLGVSCWRHILTQCLLNDGPPSATVAQHKDSTGPVSFHGLVNIQGVISGLFVKVHSDQYQIKSWGSDNQYGKWEICYLCRERSNQFTLYR